MPDLSDRSLTGLTVSAVALAAFIAFVRMLVQWAGGTFDALTELVIVVAGLGELLVVLLVIAVAALAGARQVISQARALRTEWRRWRR